jgi:hypothetical protein
MFIHIAYSVISCVSSFNFLLISEGLSLLLMRLSNSSGFVRYRNSYRLIRLAPFPTLAYPDSFLPNARQWIALLPTECACSIFLVLSYTCHYITSTYMYGGGTVRVEMRSMAVCRAHCLPSSADVTAP